MTKRAVALAAAVLALAAPLLAETAGPGRVFPDVPDRPTGTITGGYQTVGNSGALFGGGRLPVGGPHPPPLRPLRGITVGIPQDG